MKIIAAHNEENPSRKELVRGLVAYNDQSAPLEQWQFIGFYALDENNNLIGGIQGNFEWDWLHITHLWVKTAKNGLGRALMTESETYAKQQGKRGIFLDTFDFQAKPFYEKMGFAVFGTIENAAGPHTRYFLRKTINKS